MKAEGNGLEPVAGHDRSWIWQLKNRVSWEPKPVRQRMRGPEPVEQWRQRMRGRGTEPVEQWKQRMRGTEPVE